MLFNFKLFARIYYFVLLLIVLISAGTLGFMFIEEWSLVDSFYMTIITMSTVGFSEVNELSMHGKIFTSLLIISSFGTFAYAISSITTYLVGGEYKKYFKEYKTLKNVKNMENHVIICGYGRVGKQVADDLKAHGDLFVVIENNDDVILDGNEEEVHFLKGDSTHDETLKRANIDRAKAVITCLPKDADNIYVVLAAREFKEDILIVSRASFPSAVSKLKMAGANNIIMPDSIGGSHMASLIVNPDVMEFLDIIRVQGFRGANIESISFKELPPDFQNKTIGQLESKRITGVTIIGFKTPAGEYIINPDLDLEVVPNSKLFVLGSTSQIQKLHEHYGIAH